MSNIGNQSLMKHPVTARAIALLAVTFCVLPSCKNKSECETTVDLVRKCRLNSGISDQGSRDKQIAMCEAARETWPDVQDEIDCAVAASADCKTYRECERGVQRTRLIDEAMRLRSQGVWEPTPQWCAIFKDHRKEYPDVIELCRSTAGEGGKESPKPKQGNRSEQDTPSGASPEISR